MLANPPFGGQERKEVQQNFPIRTGETAFLFLQHFIRMLKAGGRAGVVIKNTFLSNTDNASVSLRKLLSELDVLKSGDILTVRSNGNLKLIGRCILASKVPEKVSHSGFTIRIRLTDRRLLPQFLCHFMKCSSAKRRLIEGGTGTSIKSLSQQTLSSLVVPFPPIDEQQLLVAKLDSIAAETQRLESVYQRKLTALDTLKSSLLHQAFSGHL